MASHLFIGLGGTGGKVLRELRKRVYEEFNSNEPGHGIFLDYIYLDSSDDDLNDRTGWKVMGTSVHLGEAQKVSIHGISSQMFDNIKMYPGLNSFLNSQDLQLIKEKMGPLVTAGIGGQRRRLGRILMANNLGDKSNSKNFETVLCGAIGRLQKDSGDANVTFHICAGLAGGTGSGSIIDVIAQIRKLYPYNSDTKFYKMNLVLYVPEANVVIPKHDAGFYQANGYAALQEINAISVGKYHPLDATGEKDSITGDVQRLLNSESFESAYVYTNVNEEGKILDMGTELPSAVADFLFQMSVTNEISGDAGQMKRLVGCENDGAGPEPNMAGDKVRSRKFLSFGITRIEFPETEIREYMSYNYAVQAVRQLVYNKWQEGIGYGTTSYDEIGVGFIEDIHKNRRSYKIDFNSLTLQEPIIDTDASKKWKNFATTWSSVVEDFSVEVTSEYESDSWINEFDKLADEFYDKNFRSFGVRKFYDNQAQEKIAYAKFIRRNIEEKLFNEWLVGEKSVLEVEKYTDKLIEESKGFIETIKDKMNAFIGNSSELTRSIKETRDLFKKKSTGFFNNLTNKPEKIFQEYVALRREYFESETGIVALEYAKELLQEIIKEFGSMQSGIAEYKETLSGILDEFEDEANSKCKTEEEANDTRIKKYDVEMVHTFARQYCSNKVRQDTNAGSIRNKLAEQLGVGGERSFANLYEKVKKEEAIDIMLEECKLNAEDAMNNTAESNSYDKMVNVNILEKLERELTSSDKLENFVKEAIKTAMTYVQFNQEEKSKRIGTEDGSMMDMIQLSMPKGDEKTNSIRSRIIAEFKRQYPRFNDDDVSVNYKSNQIVIVSAKSGFPIRYVSNVKVLKEKYDKLMIAQDKELNRMVLHTESFAEPLPSLFEMTPAEMKKGIERPLILAYILDIIKTETNPQTGAKFEAFYTHDDLGDRLLELGKSFPTTLTALSNDYKNAEILKRCVADSVKKVISNDQKKQLKDRAVKFLNEKILAEMCGNNQLDTQYEYYRNILMDIVSNELKEL